MTYPVIELPPLLLGALQFRVTLESPAVTAGTVGALGAE